MKYRYSDNVTLNIPDNVRGHEYAVGFMSGVFKNDPDSIEVNVYCIVNTSSERPSSDLRLTDRRNKEENIELSTGRLWKLNSNQLQINSIVFIEFGKFPFNCFRIYTESDLVNDPKLRDAFGVTIGKVISTQEIYGLEVEDLFTGAKVHGYPTRRVLQEGFKFCYGVNSDVIESGRIARESGKYTYMMSFANVPLSIFTSDNDFSQNDIIK